MVQIEVTQRMVIVTCTVCGEEDAGNRRRAREVAAAVIRMADHVRRHEIQGEKSTATIERDQ